MPSRQKRRRAQAGTTLVEVVVSMAIVSFALLLLVGAFSTGILDATLVKRNTAADGAVEFELERIQGANFAASAQPYSECFAVDTAAAPRVVAYQAACPAGSNLRLDVTEADVQAGAVQRWTIQVRTYPAEAAIGTPVSVYKINR